MRSFPRQRSMPPLLAQKNAVSPHGYGPDLPRTLQCCHIYGEVGTGEDVGTQRPRCQCPKTPVHKRLQLMVRVPYNTKNTVPLSGTIYKHAAFLVLSLASIYPDHQYTG